MVLARTGGASRQSASGPRNGLPATLISHDSRSRRVVACGRFDRDLSVYRGAVILRSIPLVWPMNVQSEDAPRVAKHVLLALICSVRP